MTAAAKSDFAPVEFLSLLKLPLLTAGLTHAEIRRLVRDYEKEFCAAAVMTKFRKKKSTP